MISHNMDDVRSVADRIAVLRLGRNNGTFDAETASQEDIVAAITGGLDNAVTRRSHRRRPSVVSTNSEEARSHE
jgi:ABC-type sugar transport system ATPase subunit